MFETPWVEEIAAWHNGLTGIDQMIVFVRRNPAGLCEVEVRTVEGSRLQELLTEANALALAAQIRKRARGRWERVLVPAEL